MGVSFQKLNNFLEEKSYIYKKDEPLKNHTTFKIGGACSFLILPTNTEQISLLMKECVSLNIPYTILGKGSNMLVSDDGYQGVVIKLTDAYSKIEVCDTILECEAGAALSNVCHTAYEHGLTGLEFAYGIPGTIGGALFMNAGAYGGEMVDVVIGTEHITSSFEMESFKKENLNLAYRHSVYSNLVGYCITKVKIQLAHGEKKAIKEAMDDYWNRRKTKQPLEFPSAGSTFKRPEGNYASALIEQCGLKGVTIGDAQVSKKHSGFLINKGNASCKDVLDLIELVQNSVKAKTGYSLECEIKRLP